MKADDPRHGTHRGYVVGCRMLCCVGAHTRYMKLYRMGRIPRLIPATGTVRRIQALQALGWSYGHIGAVVGKSDNWAYMISRSPSVTTTTATLVARTYDELSMRVPPGGYADRTRRRARAKGWAPPLAWDDIDDPNEQPADWEYAPAKRPNQVVVAEPVDPVVVMRLLEGQRLPNATRAEREAAIAQWIADGGPEKELCEWHGWKTGRYTAHLRLVGEAS